MRWKSVFIRFNGETQWWPTTADSADSNRNIDDGYWKTILNLPGMVVVEWVDKPLSPSFNRYQIFVRVD